MNNNKHQQYDLAQMQSLPLKYKVIMTKDRIRAWYEYWDGQVYVSRSGGKDSDVLGHIVKEMYPDVPQVFVNTGLEYDSVRIHATEECNIVLRPEKSFLQVVTEYGYPVISKEVAETIYQARKYNADTGAYIYRIKKLNGEHLDKNGNKSQYNLEKWKYLLDAPFRISHNCCNVMKKNPSKQYEKISCNKAFIGTMAVESRLRKSKWIRFGCNAFESKRPTSQPLSFWTEQDILQYIKENNLKIAEVYGDIVYTDDDDGMTYDNNLFTESVKLQTTGANRTGCVFCMFGITQDTDRFIRLKAVEPKKYDYIMRGGKFDDKGLWIPDKGLGYKFVIDWLNEHGNLNIKY